MDFFDDKLLQDLGLPQGLDFGLLSEQDPFSSISEMNFSDFLGPDVLREFVDPVVSPLSQQPEQPTCYDEFDGFSACASSPASNPAPSFRSSSSKKSEMTDSASPPPAMLTRVRATAPPRAASAASSSVPKLHPSYAPSPSLAPRSPSSSVGGRGCPKRHRKTIQIKRQEQQGRLETLTSRNAKLQEAIRLAATEVSAARQTLYTVLKTARQGHLDAFSPAP